MAPFAQHSSVAVYTPGTTALLSTVIATVTAISYSTKGSTPMPVSSITTIPSSSSISTATPTYITKGSPTPTNTSLRGSQPPSKMAIQSSTLAFVIFLTILVGVALGFLAWKKGWGYRNTVVAPLQQAKAAMVQRQDSTATLVDESSIRMHRKERTVSIEVRELGLQGNGAVSSVIHVPKKTF